jgi:predicted lipoprotein with Yx(FWY)xxD motif
MRIRKYALAAILAAASLAAAGCSGGQAATTAGADAPTTTGASSPSPTSRPGPQADAAAVTIKISDSRYGRILTDLAGRTLYGFLPDKNGASACGEDCVATWPPLTSRAPVTAASGASSALLGKTVRTEGAVQATYGNWPLYYYAGDMQPGDVDGQGVNGIWFVIGANGKLVKTTA